MAYNGYHVVACNASATSQVTGFSLMMQAPARIARRFTFGGNYGKCAWPTAEGHSSLVALRYGMDTMDSEQTLLSVGDAAKRLERSTEQVRRYLREGRLKGQRIGGQWFIERATLDHFAAAARTQQSFVQRLGKASAIHPLNDVIGIGQGTGSNIGEGKLAYRLAAARRRG